MSDVKVAWVMPTYGPIWAPAYTSHMKAIAYASRYFTVSDLGSVCGIGATDRMTLDAAEVCLIHDVLEDASFTHVFWTESDMLLPTNCLPRLMDLDKEIASGLYILRAPTPESAGQPCLFVKHVTPADNPYVHTPVTIFPTDAPFRLNGCPGFGCALMKTSIFANLPKPYFSIVNGKHGSDMYFYTNCLNAGIEVWVDPRVRCTQIDYFEVSFEDWLKRMREDKQWASGGYILNAMEA